MSAALLIMASGLPVACACDFLFSPGKFSVEDPNSTKCEDELAGHPAIRAWKENLFTEQRADGDQVTHAYNWHCTLAMMRPLNKYGKCLCDRYGKTVDEIDATCQSLSEVDMHSMLGGVLSLVVNLRRPGTIYDRNGAATKVTMYSLQFSWTMETATGCPVSYEVEIKHAVATSAGVHTRQVRINFGELTRLSGEEGSGVLATIDRIPSESSAAVVQLRARVRLKVEIEKMVPHANVSSVEVSSPTKVNVSVEEAFDHAELADSAQGHSQGFSLLFAAALGRFFMNA